MLWLGALSKQAKREPRVHTTEARVSERMPASPAVAASAAAILRIKKFLSVLGLGGKASCLTTNGYSFPSEKMRVGTRLI
jgi:hypothetical protein